MVDERPVNSWNSTGIYSGHFVSAYCSQHATRPGLPAPPRSTRRSV